MRKMKVVATLVFVCMMSVLMLSSPVMAQQAYLMVCKGGGMMKLEVNPSAKQMMIEFYKAPKSATQQEPSPGQCAWVDRPINASEPSKLRIGHAPDPLFHLLNVRANSTIITGPKGDFAYFYDAIKNSQKFYVHCNNPGLPFFNVTKIGP